MTERQKAYRVYLQTEHWAGLREAALVRDRHKCRECGRKHGLQVHHTVYRGNWMDGLLEDLKTLCRKCHAKEHGYVLIGRDEFIIYRDDLRFSAFIHRIICLRHKLYSGRPLRQRDERFLQLALKVYPPTKSDTCIKYHVGETYRVERFMREHPGAICGRYARKPVINRRTSSN